MEINSNKILSKSRLQLAWTSELESLAKKAALPLSYQLLPEKGAAVIGVVTSDLIHKAKFDR